MDKLEIRAEENIEMRQAAEAVIERVYLAVYQLCTGQGDVRKRLQVAVATLLPIHESEFPSELREDLNWIISQSTKYPSETPKFRGDLEETMRRIRNSSGQKIAKRIFHLYSRLQSIRGFPLIE